MSNVLYVNKPKGISSFDVCFKLRKVLGTKKIGHTGTLDPNATGVMVILYNNATKANPFLVVDNKEYIATVRLGIRTDTLDIDGNILEQRDCKMPSKEKIEEVLLSFLGKQSQEVPITSAIKVNGKKLYQYQMENKEVELPIREFYVYSIELLSQNEREFVFSCKVSSGTYVRALTRDILSKLDVIGTLSGLVRSKVDDISLKDCDDLSDILNGNFTAHDLIDVLSKKYVTYEVDNPIDIMNGKRLKIDSNQEKLLMVSKGDLLAIYQKVEDHYECLRGLL